MQLTHNHIQSIFDSVKGWTTNFNINNRSYGGSVPLLEDSRLLWHISHLGDLSNQRALELGPLEGAHSITLLNHNLKDLIAIEGNPDCYQRCLIVKEVYNLTNVEFILTDFCDYVKTYFGLPFDFVSAAGVLYHQTNPIELIYNLSKITNTVLVWSQVASEDKPSKTETSITFNNKTYNGKINDYGDAKATINSYCGGLHSKAVWLYPEDMINCFKDAGFKNIVINTDLSTHNINGESLLFVAKKV